MANRNGPERMPARHRDARTMNETRMQSCNPIRRPTLNLVERAVLPVNLVLGLLTLLPKQDVSDSAIAHSRLQFVSELSAGPRDIVLIQNCGYYADALCPRAHHLIHVAQIN